MVLYCSPRWPGTHYLAKYGLSSHHFPSAVLRLQTWVTTPNFIFDSYWTYSLILKSQFLARPVMLALSRQVGGNPWLFSARDVWDLRERLILGAELTFKESKWWEKGIRMEVEGQWATELVAQPHFNTMILSLWKCCPGVEYRIQFDLNRYCL